MSETLIFELTNEREAFGAFQSFCRLWGSKGCGSLSLKTSGGDVVMNFEQHLGSLHCLRPGPLGRQGEKEHHQDPEEGFHKTSRQRRREKRAASKVSAENVKTPVNISESSPNQKKIEPKPEKDSSTDFKCDLCEFTTSDKNGMSVHKRHKHKDIKILLDDK